MDLKNFLPNQVKKVPKKNFWAVIVEQDWVQAGIWTIEDGKAKVLYSSVPSAWGLDEELVNAADACLSSAIQEYPEDEKEPSEVVFGVSTGWVDGGEIKPEFLEKIKKICSELALTPVGFVVLPEAIAHFLKSEEESPVSAVVIGVYSETLEIARFKQGNLIGTTQVARSVSVAEDVAEGLTRFAGEENIFSRFVLYDGKEGELEDIRQELIKVNWEDYPKLKFLHTPKVEIVDHQKKIEAVALAGASEMAGVKKIHHESVIETPPQEDSEQGLDGDNVQLSPEEAGFVLDKDITEVQPREKVGLAEENVAMGSDREEIENVAPVDRSVYENLGDKTNFQINNEETSYETPSVSNQDQPDMSNEETAKRKLNLPQLKVAALLANFKKRFAFLRSLKRFPGIFQAGRSTLVLGIGFLLVIFVLGFAAWWFMPTASVTIYVAPKRQEEKITIKVDSKVDVSDFESSTLKGKVLDTSLTGDKTKSTTGTKTVGEKAKGEVTIYRVGSKLNLTSGTVIHGPSGLDFTLDSDVELASGSAGSPGTVKVAVSAKDIGVQYNLAADSNFTVSNYSTSDMEAKNEASFSGGTSREIQAVSEEDQEVLSEELKNELTDKAKEELKTQLSEGKFMIEESLTSTSSGVKFSSKVGDEAESLKLTLTTKASVVIVDRKEMLELASKALKDKIPSGFILRNEQINTEFEFDSKKGDIYEFEVFIEANLLPDVKTDEIVKEIRGKYPEIAKEYMTKGVPGFVRAEIKIKPNLPNKLNILPKVSKNIEVEIAAER